jgi:uncharacterized protein YndB with AHSA1/START domain
MREGTGEVEVPVAPREAFAYLADPRHAPRWFAGVEVVDAPQGPIAMGVTWRFIQTQSGGRASPTRMALYEPPTRFVWRTARRWPATNLTWEVNCLPVTENPRATLLRLTIRIEPGPLGWLSVLAASAFRSSVIADRAQRAVERARDVLVASSPTPRGPSIARPPRRRQSRRNQ